MKYNFTPKFRLAIAVVSLSALVFTSSCGGSSDLSAAVANSKIEGSPNPTAPIVEKQDEIDFSKIQTVSYCELTKNPTKYDQKIVSVRVLYLNAFERTYIFDETCEYDQTPTAPEKFPAETWAEWDKSFLTIGDSNEAKLNRQLIGFGKKDVTVVGKFSSTSGRNGDGPSVPFGSENSCRFLFQIIKLEKIVLKPSSFDSRVKFMTDQPIEIADFTIEFIGKKTETEVSGRENRSYIFKIKKGKLEKQISWSSDASVQSTSFEVGDENYFLELENSRQFGKLAIDELVIRRPKP